MKWIFIFSLLIRLILCGSSTTANQLREESVIVERLLESFSRRNVLSKNTFLETVHESLESARKQYTILTKEHQQAILDHKMALQNRLINDFEGRNANVHFLSSGAPVHLKFEASNTLQDQLFTLKHEIKVLEELERRIKN